MQCEFETFVYKFAYDDIAHYFRENNHQEDNMSNEFIATKGNIKFHSHHVIIMDVVRSQLCGWIKIGGRNCTHLSHTPSGHTQYCRNGENPSLYMDLPLPTFEMRVVRIRYCSLQIHMFMAEKGIIFAW